MQLADDHNHQTPKPEFEGTDWIDSMPDDQCMEVFWLYVDPPEPFLDRHPPALLGAALRRALREIAADPRGLPLQEHRR